MESSQARACWSCCVVVVAELLVRLKKRREARPSVFFAFTVWCRDVRKVRPLPCHPVEGCGGCPVGALGSTSDGRCSSAGVHLPVFICRCSSAGVYLPVFICRCEGGGAGRSDPAATAGAHQVCCRGALPRCAAEVRCLAASQGQVVQLRHPGSNTTRHAISMAGSLPQGTRLPSAWGAEEVWASFKFEEHSCCLHRSSKTAPN